MEKLWQVVIIEMSYDAKSQRVGKKPSTVKNPQSKSSILNGLGILIVAFFGWIHRFPTQEIDHERPQAREFELGIDVVFDHVKREIVKPGGTPNRDGHQKNQARVGELIHNQAARQHCAK